MSSDSDYDPETALTFPPPEPCDIPTVNPGPLLPLETPPPALSTADLPDLPSIPRKSLLDRWYTLSTHLVPAAYPRTTPHVPLPTLPQWTPDRDEFKAATRKTAEEVFSINGKQWHGALDALPRSTAPLWNCLNRYVRKRRAARSESTGRKTGVTLFFAHANGFPKEIWEPTLERLVTQHSTTATYDVGEIWAWEAANHGDACLLNRDSIGGLYDWRDNCRDILHFLLYYLPATASPDVLPTHLTRLPDAEAASRRARGLQGRNLLPVGHSFGACTLARVAIEQPALFKSLFLLEPIIRPFYEGGDAPNEALWNYVTGAVQRRDGWSSREEARRLFSATPFFAAWDPAVLDVYVECGLYETPDGQFKLKMPGIQEGICFAHSYLCYETFELLETLDERVELRWLAAAKIPWYDSEYRRLTAFRRPANSSHKRVLSSGHLIAQEVPAVLAKEIHEFLSSRYGMRKALL